MRFVPAAPKARSRAGVSAGGPASERIVAQTDAALARERDPRVDFFRGLALWFIFLDHVPSNTIGHLTLRNFGFSDATEIFVFISGYSAAIAYGRSERKSAASST